jgi:hypothetical protein
MDGYRQLWEHGDGNAGGNGSGYDAAGGLGRSGQHHGGVQCGTGACLTDGDG